MASMLRHIAYTGGWKKMEPLWSLVVRLKRLPIAIPLLERILRAGGASGAPEREFSRVKSWVET